jgi:hypothetical protein
VENLQVLHYGPGGEFVPHHDGEARILTVLYYLNGVGGTWFPLARGYEDCDGKEKNGCGWDQFPVNKGQALELMRGLEPGKDGLLVIGIAGTASSSFSSNGDDIRSKEEVNEHIAWVNQGDAIAFYNYLDDGSEQIDWTSIHCGLPTTEEEGGGAKWIANHWYRMSLLEEI